MSALLRLFPAPRRGKLRVIAHMSDTGEPGAVFTCRRCGWTSGWVEATPRQIWRGIPCERCNEVTDGT